MKPHRCLARWIACSLLLTATLPGEEFTLHTGFDYSTGDYGLPVSTEILTLPLSISYATGRTTWDLGLSYLRIDGPGQVVPGVGRFTRRLLQSKRVSEGVGDFTLGFTKDFSDPEKHRWALAAGAEVKFGTASAVKSLGTGKDDFATHVDFNWQAGAFMPFATLGYRWLGNPPGADLRNYLFGTVGINWSCTEATTVAVLADWAAKNSDSGRASANFTLAVTRQFGEQWQIQAYGVLGHSDSTADHGYGLSLGRRF